MPAEISVVVPVYNTEKYLVQCLDSIVNQTYKDIEIICVDDCSTDGSLDILREYEHKDKRMKVIHRDKQSGSAALPRNTGMDLACGKYIIFLDSDDYFELEMLEKLHDCAELNHADMVICGNYICDDMTGDILDAEGDIHHEFISDVAERNFSYADVRGTIFQMTNLATWHKFFLRDVAVRNNLRFQEGVPILDDVLFVSELLISAKNMRFLDEKLVYYRRLRTGGQTFNISRCINSLHQAFGYLYNRLKERGVYDEVKISLQNFTLGTMQWWYDCITDDKSAREYYGLCRDKYFSLFELDKMLPGDMDVRYADFYSYICDGEYRPSIYLWLEKTSESSLSIVIYGAGMVGRNLINLIEKEYKHRVILWVDRNADQIKDPRISRPERILEYKHDAVLIAIGNKRIAEDAKNDLVKLGVEENCIYM